MTLTCCPLAATAPLPGVTVAYCRPSDVVVNAGTVSVTVVAFDVEAAAHLPLTPPSLVPSPSSSSSLLRNHVMQTNDVPLLTHGEDEPCKLQTHLMRVRVRVRVKWLLSAARNDVRQAKLK